MILEFTTTGPQSTHDERFLGLQRSSTSYQALESTLRYRRLKLYHSQDAKVFPGGEDIPKTTLQTQENVSEPIKSGHVPYLEERKDSHRIPIIPTIPTRTMLTSCGRRCLSTRA